MYVIIIKGFYVTRMTAMFAENRGYILGIKMNDAKVKLCDTTVACSLNDGAYRNRTTHKRKILMYHKAVRIKPRFSMF